MQKNLMRYFTFLTLIGLLVTLIAGCGERIPKLAEVSGTLVANGEPVSGVDVFFMPDPLSDTFQKGAQMSRGRTGPDGKFTLVYDGMADKTGAAVGMHRIRLIDVTSEEARDNPIPYRFSQELVNGSTTPLKVEVPAEGTSNVEIDISKYME